MELLYLIPLDLTSFFLRRMSIKHEQKQIMPIEYVLAPFSHISLEEKEKKNNSVAFDAKSKIWMCQFIYLFLVFPIVMTLVILSISEGFPPPPSSLFSSSLFLCRMLF